MRMFKKPVSEAAARIFRLPIPLIRGVAEAALYCAHRATTALSWGLCEQEGHLAAPRSVFQHPHSPLPAISSMRGLLMSVQPMQMVSKRLS